MSTQAPSSLVRGIALALAAVAIVSIGIEFVAEWQEMGAEAQPLVVLWRLMRYFTILTNFLVFVIFARMALGRPWPGPGLSAALTVWIVATGVIFHALLAANSAPEGWQVYSDIGMHTVTPVGCLLLWLINAPKTPLTWWMPLLWTGYPLGYAVYVIGRGLIEGKFPYFFLNPVASGVPTVMAYVVALGIFFLLSGGLLVALAHALRRKDLST